MLQHRFPQRGFQFRDKQNPVVVVAGAGSLAQGQEALSAANLALSGLTRQPHTVSTYGSGSGDVSAPEMSGEADGGSLSSVSADSDAVANAAESALYPVSAATSTSSLLPSEPPSPLTSSGSSTRTSHSSDGRRMDDCGSSWIHDLPSPPGGATAAAGVTGTAAVASAHAMHAGGAAPAAPGSSGSPSSEQRAEITDGRSAAQAAEEVSYADLTAQLASGLSTASSVISDLQQHVAVGPAGAVAGARDAAPAQNPSAAPIGAGAPPQTEISGGPPCSAGEAATAAGPASSAGQPPQGSLAEPSSTASSYPQQQTRRSTVDGGSPGQSSSSDGGSGSLNDAIGGMATAEERHHLEQQLRDLGLGDALHDGSQSDSNAGDEVRIRPARQLSAIALPDVFI